MLESLLLQKTGGHRPGFWTKQPVQLHQAARLAAAPPASFAPCPGCHLIPCLLPRPTHRPMFTQAAAKRNPLPPLSSSVYALPGTLLSPVLSPPMSSSARHGAGCGQKLVAGLFQPHPASWLGVGRESRGDRRVLGSA